MSNQILKVLLADDDLDILSFIKTKLSENNIQTIAVSNGKEALVEIESNKFDVIVLDWMMPYIDGFSLVKKVRESNIKTPIIMLSALDSTENIVNALENGGDDYLTKPFSVEELIARIRMLHRRFTQSTSIKTVIDFEDLHVDKVEHKVYRDSIEVPLQPQEYKILLYLLENIDTKISKTMLLKHVWNYDFDPQTNIVEVHMSRLRNKLKEGGKTDIISTVRGLGYVIKSK